MSPYKNKEDKLKYQREWYKKNRESVLLKVKLAKETKRDFVNNIKKEAKCKCGETRWYVLEFHHRDEKEFSIAKALMDNLGYDRIKREIDKCDIICANCHKEFHHLERQCS